MLVAEKTAPEQSSFWGAEAYRILRADTEIGRIDMQTPARAAVAAWIRRFASGIIPSNAVWTLRAGRCSAAFFRDG